MPNYITVSFTDFKTPMTSGVPVTHKFNDNKILWFLNEKETREMLGFTGDPKIVYVDAAPTDHINPLSFTLYGGTKCFPGKPCKVSIVHTDGPKVPGTFTAEITDNRGRVTKVESTPYDEKDFLTLPPASHGSIAH